MAKYRRSKDQKRRAKIRERIHKFKDQLITPYEGKKYRGSEWTQAVFNTELGVLESLTMLDQRLSNQEVEKAFKELVERLRQGVPPSLPDEELNSTQGDPVEMVIWNIRRNWKYYEEKHGAVAIQDWEGILRTLLYSIKAHAWKTGSMLGYLHFLKGFMGRMGVDCHAISAEEAKQLGYA